MTRIIVTAIAVTATALLAAAAPAAADAGPTIDLTRSQLIQPAAARAMGPRFVCVGYASAHKANCGDVTYTIGSPFRFYNCRFSTVYIATSTNSFLSFLFTGGKDPCPAFLR